MFARAKACYERFLSLHETEDMDRTAATLALKKVKTQRANLGAEGVPDANRGGVAMRKR